MYLTKERLYTMAEVAAELNITGVGSYNLYYYLKELNVINHDRTPVIKYIALGYFEVDYGTRNKSSSRLYSKTVVTAQGLIWLKEEIKPRILEEQKKYLDKHKKDK